MGKIEKRNPSCYLNNDINCTNKQLLESAKEDKLCLGHPEFRELFVQRMKNSFVNELKKERAAKLRKIFSRLVGFLVDMINFGTPIIVGNFGVISKRIQKTPGRYDVVSKLYLDKEYFIIKFTPCPKFVAWFQNKDNRQVLCDKIHRRSVEFVAKYGEIKIISGQ